MNPYLWVAQDISSKGSHVFASGISELCEWSVAGMKMGGTATNVPVGSRTTVQESTQEGLTSGFGMGPGITPPLWPCTPHLRI